MKITFIDIAKIKLNPDNPRIIKDDKFAKLVKSIQDFPEMLELRPIIVNSKMMVLGGNMRLKACKEAGLKKVPIIQADKLTPEQQREFIIKDNVGFGVWNWQMINQDWNTDQLTDWGLDVEPFTTDEDSAEDGYTAPDDIKTDIVLGDLFEIGSHRLLCGDSLKADEVSKLMKSQKANVCVTSPPYNQGGSKGDLFSHGKRNESLYQNDCDNKTKEEYFEFCMDIFQNLLAQLDESHTVVWNVSYNAKSRDDYGKIIFSDRNPFTVKETIVWNKGGRSICHKKEFILGRPNLCLL